jgi:hypothetical protein
MEIKGLFKALSFGEGWVRLILQKKPRFAAELNTLTIYN